MAWLDTETNRVTDTITEQENEAINLADDKLDRMIHILEEILRWTRLEGLQTAKTIITELFKTDVEKLLYESSDGRTSREIAEVAGVSHVTVINYWKKWARYGIVEELRTRRGTRCRRIFSLSDFGMEVSEVKSMSPAIVSVKREDHDKEKASEHQV